MIQALLVGTGLLAAVAAGLIYLAPEAATRAVLNFERRRSGLVRKEITLPDGSRYVYLEGGQGETLMLLHGFGADKDNFTRVARFLTPHYKVIIPDHIGFGESSHPQEADYSPPAQVERLRAFAGALDAGILHLGGSSMGGQIALTYAGQYPGEIASLWLLGPAGSWSAPGNEVFDIVEKTESGYNPLLARNEEEFAQVFAFTMNDPPFVPRPILDVMAQARIKNYELEKRIFQQISDYAVEGLIAGLRTPCLIVFGEMDRAIPLSTAGILHELLPDSQVIMMHGIGHLPMIERPRQSAMDYLEFRSGISSNSLS